MKALTKYFIELMALICLFQCSYAQKKDSVILKIDELKKSYQKKDTVKAISLSKEIYEIFSNYQLNIEKSKGLSSEEKDLPTLLQVVKDGSFETTLWDLSINYRQNEYKAITHDVYKIAIDTFSNYLPDAEFKQAQKYKKEIKDAFQWFTLYCGNIAEFLPTLSKRPIPFRFAVKDNKKCVLLTGMASTTIYNTLRSTAKSRASKILESCLLPEVKHFYQAFSKTDISYIGFIIYYGSKDFSQKSDVLNLKPEVLAFVASREMCEKFIAGDITESEFVTGCESYLTDRDMTFDFKKVKLEIE